MENHPYTIVIQLPKEEEKHRDDSYGQRKRKFERIPAYTAESDYIEDEDEAESKVVNVNDRKVQIKVNILYEYRTFYEILKICLTGSSLISFSFFFFFMIPDGQRWKSETAYQNIKIGQRQKCRNYGQSKHHWKRFTENPREFFEACATIDSILDTRALFWEFSTETSFDALAIYIII